MVCLHLGTGLSSARFVVIYFSDVGQRELATSLVSLVTPTWFVVNFRMTN